MKTSKLQKEQLRGMGDGTDVLGRTAGLLLNLRGVKSLNCRDATFAEKNWPGIFTDSHRSGINEE